MTPTARIGLLTVVSVDGNKCACVCDCGASVVRSVQVLRRAKGLAAQSSCLTAAQEWHVIFDGCFYVANCPSLRLTTMSETYDELPEMISDILQHLLRDLLRSGELETFLQKHGWEKHGPAVVATQEDVRFDVPWYLTRGTTTGGLEHTC